MTRSVARKLALVVAFAAAGLWVYLRFLSPGAVEPFVADTVGGIAIVSGLLAALLTGRGAPVFRRVRFTNNSTKDVTQVTVTPRTSGTPGTSKMLGAVAAGADPVAYNDATQGGWHASTNNVHVRVDLQGGTHFEFLHPPSPLGNSSYAATCEFAMTDATGNNKHIESHLLHGADTLAHWILDELSSDHTPSA